MRSLNVLLLLLCSAPVLECAQWIRLSSTNFDLYTTTAEEEARATLETFEQTREFFLRTKSFLVTPGMPVVLVAFNTTKEYKLYSAKEFVPAYFVGDEQRDYIVMSDLGRELTRVAIHEYVHVLVRHSGLRIPLWLNEGLADVYSGMKARESGGILLGNIPDDRAYSLGSGNWMRIGALLNVRGDSLEYNEANRQGMFYAQSCLLAHMLMLGDGYADKFSTFVDRIATSSSAQQVFAEVYRKSLAEVEKDMLSYFRQNTIGGTTYGAVTSKVEFGPLREPTELEVELVLAKVVGLLGRFDEARTRLERMSIADPGNRDVQEAQAYLAWRTGDNAMALRMFKQALAQEGSSWKAYWDYARLLHLVKGDRATRIDALRAGLDLKPEFAPARLMLARDLYAIGRRSAALSELRQIREAPGAEALLKELENLSAGSSAERPASVTDDEEKRPILRRRDPQKPPQRSR